MGCGSSKSDSENKEACTPRDAPLTKPKNGLNGISNGHVMSDINFEKKNARNKISSTDANSNVTHNPEPVAKSVAFNLTLDGQNTDSLILKHPPKRLERLTLEPLEVTKLTPEMLLEKQKIADMKREEVLKKKLADTEKASKRRREILQAKEFSLQRQQTESEIKLTEKMKVADMTRDAKLAEKREKQRLHDERAKRIRERATKIKQSDQSELGTLEIEKDHSFNKDDVDSWLDGERNHGDGSSEIGERIYSGRSSPKKSVGNSDNRRLHATTSASTVDSFDNAFGRKPPSASKTRTINVSGADEFFDS